MLVTQLQGTRYFGHGNRSHGLSKVPGVQCKHCILTVCCDKLCPQRKTGINLYADSKSVRPRQSSFQLALSTIADHARIDVLVRGAPKTARRRVGTCHGCRARLQKDSPDAGPDWLSLAVLDWLVHMPVAQTVVTYPRCNTCACWHPKYLAKVESTC